MENFQKISEKLVNFIAKNPELDSVFVEHFHKNLSYAAISFESLIADSKLEEKDFNKISELPIQQILDLIDKAEALNINTDQLIEIRDSLQDWQNYANKKNHTSLGDEEFKGKLIDATVGYREVLYSRNKNISTSPIATFMDASSRGNEAALEIAQGIETIFSPPSFFVNSFDDIYHIENGRPQFFPVEHYHDDIYNLLSFKPESQSSSLKMVLEEISPRALELYQDSGVSNELVQEVYDSYVKRMNDLQLNSLADPNIKRVLDEDTPQYFYMVSPDEYIFGGDYGFERDIVEGITHLKIKNTIEASGGTVIYVNGYSQHNGSNERWSRDTGLPLISVDDQTIFLPTHNRHFDTRNGGYNIQAQAQENISRVLSSIDFIPLSNSNIEGGDASYHPQLNTLFIATRVYDSENFDDLIIDGVKEAGLDTKVFTLEVQEPYGKTFYHLDTFMNTLPTGEIVIYPDVLKKESYEALKGFVGEGNIIEISYSEARHFATNYIAVGNNIIMPSIPYEEQSKMILDIESLGYNVIQIENAIDRGNGSIHCNVLDLTLNPITAKQIELQREAELTNNINSGLFTEDELSLLKNIQLTLNAGQVDLKGGTYEQLQDIIELMKGTGSQIATEEFSKNINQFIDSLPETTSDKVRDFFRR